MILMPELCYYCREELNFGDLTLHDGHRVHKKCLPPINDTNKWDEAARKAAEECFLSDWRYVGIIEPIIAKHHADLRATYELLIELAKYVDMRQEMETTPQDKNATYFDKLFAVKCALLSILTNPLVRAAIERSNGNV